MMLMDFFIPMFFGRGLHGSYGEFLLRVREGSENKDTNSKNLPSPPNINRLGILCAAKHYFRSAVPTSHDVFRKIIIASVAVRVSFGYTAR